MEPFTEDFNIAMNISVQEQDTEHEYLYELKQCSKNTIINSHVNMELWHLKVSYTKMHTIIVS